MAAGSAVLAVLAGCAPTAGTAEAGAPAETGGAEVRLVEGSHAGELQVFEVRRASRLFRVDIADIGGGARRVIVTMRGSRGLQRADARLAHEAAEAAARLVDCAGQPLLILPETATYQEQDRSTVLVGGAPAYVFEARCG